MLKRVSPPTEKINNMICGVRPGGRLSCMLYPDAANC